jgi:membrane-bound lytic murein transglycosylase D
VALAPHLDFKVDERLQRNVDFWIKVYTQYTTSQGVIHDARYVDKIYEVLDSKGAAANASKRKWRSVLLSLHKKWIRTAGGGMPPDLTEDERHAFKMFEDVNEPDKFLKATQRKRLRFQLGQKDRFIEGIYQSGRFLPFMEEAFRKEGLPIELTRLPFVESSFNLKARSKVGASGIWQFMRSTGRLFLSINEAVDECNDPVRATEAAAKLLKMNYESLGSWPLAVTAYNHGRKGLMRAVAKVGSSSLEDVVANYRSRSFGFASSNFFTSLLAAIEVERNAEKYFGMVQRAEPFDFIEMKLPDSVKLPILTRFLKLDSSRLRDLNPGLAPEVFKGYRRIPAGYSLRLPPPVNMERSTASKLFFAGYSVIPAIYKKPGRIRQ